MLLEDSFNYPIIKDVYDQFVCPKTENQLKLVQAIDDNDIIFVSGPAGTGKSLLAVAKAIQAYQLERTIHKIVLSRPVIESGESLGFLPGSMEEKIHPYLLPLYDYLNLFLKKTGPTRKKKKQDRKAGTTNQTNSEVPDYVEVAPLAYLRGRTFDNCFIIIDEAQNITNLQFKLILTRIGKNSKIVFTGDEKQSDLNSRVKNGFTDAIHRLVEKRTIPRITQVKMDNSDILRNGLIKEILEAYEED